jgi:hypothetical protein
MIKRQHVEPAFFAEAEALREFLDACFKDAYTQKIGWHYFCDPRMYTYLRAESRGVFPRELFDRFMQRLRLWCMENLGLLPVVAPNLNLMVNGCRLGFHSDFHNGTWGYVYSLTRWEGRRFSGGETLLMRDGVPSYKKLHVHGEALYELIPAHFNQLLVFDDRIVHATPTIEGNMNPSEGRIALVGHIRPTPPMVSGSLSWADARAVILEALPHLRERIKSYKDVQGALACRLAVAPSGVVESVTPLTDNLITPLTGYGRSDAVSAVRSVIQQTLGKLRFPESDGSSTIVASALVPIPDLQPIEFTVPHNSAPDSIHEWAAAHLAQIGGVDFQGSWEGRTFEVREPVAGSIRIEARQIVGSFDPPMWVPSQREHFQTSLTEWAAMAAAAGGGRS